MKKKKIKNNLPFYDKNVVSLLEKLVENTDDSLQKFSYWLLGQAIQGQPSLFIDCLAESQRIEPLIFLSTKEKVFYKVSKNENLNNNSKGKSSNSTPKDLER
ncbi:MAG: hypothetical protein PHH71_02310 [Clostridia bacterium]|nr:hypothetical protein [Clostridia bacterium]MDD3232530.1 hypothetical protein [Clostridia bacterium]MDD3862782.1 hypothetical protein [Clostridia bacterium]MDD4408500.1 hypothetical protein [Clostridia bacterium]